jgi:SAM-dependent methyltransferase
LNSSSRSPWDAHGVAEAINDYWEKSDFEREHRAAVAKLIQKLGSTTVLDVGCGSGLLYPLLADKTRYCGIDSSMEMLRIARKRNSHAQFLRADARCLPFRKKSFELVTCVDMLQHVDNAEAVLSQLSEVAGQHVLVVTWAHDLPTQRQSVNLSSKQGKMTQEVIPAGPFQNIVYNLNELLGWISKVDGISRHQLVIYDLGANNLVIQIDKVSDRGQRVKTKVKV